MLPLNTILEGKALEELLEREANKHEISIIDKLSQFGPNELFHVWRNFLWYVEEFININFELQEDELIQFTSCSIDYDNILRGSLNIPLEIVKNKFGLDVANRLHKLLMMISCLKLCYDSHNIKIMNFSTIGEAMKFMQSRRYHYHTLLKLIPIYSKGKKSLELIDVMNEFQYYVDTCMVGITTAYQRISQLRCINGIRGIVTHAGIEFNEEFSPLEDYSCNPIRLSELDIMQFTDFSKVPRRPRQGKLYSIEELIDTIHYEGELFSDYGLNHHRHYKMLLKLLDDIIPYFTNEYFIEIDENEFIKIQKKYTNLCLSKECGNYEEISGSLVPFVKCGSCYYSNNYAVMRFMENEIYSILYKIRRYQIKSGFIFEEKVTKVLEKYGFKRDRSVKRIRRKEFDVVCVKDDCIYNFQCKNNYFNVNDFGPTHISMLCKTNKRLESLYLGALLKEEKRESLLMKKLGISKIKHFVVSRFPIFTNNPRIINYNDLEKRLIKLS